LIGAPVIHLSTDYVFSGDRADGGYGEADPTGPRSVYGASKLAGEIAVRERQPDAVILRTSWVFSAQGSNFVRTLLRLGAERPELRIVNDQTGCPTAAADIAAAIVVLARQMLDPDDAGQGTFDGTAPGFGTLHFCGIAAVTWFGFALEIFRQAGRRGAAVPELVPIATSDWPAAAPRPARSVLDCARIRTLHGIVPRPWQAGLIETLAELLPSSTEKAA
jgi:dTDP-4-dehydrorhamnose reductase